MPNQNQPQALLNPQPLHLNLLLMHNMCRCLLLASQANCFSAKTKESHKTRTINDTIKLCQSTTILFPREPNFAGTTKWMTTPPSGTRQRSVADEENSNSEKRRKATQIKIQIEVTDGKPRRKRRSRVEVRWRAKATRTMKGGST